MACTYPVYGRGDYGTMLYVKHSIQVREKCPVMHSYQV